MEELYRKLRFSIKEGKQALTISTEEANNFDIDAMEEYFLNNSICNYNLKNIETVVHNAIDAPEIIGEVFNKFNTIKKNHIEIINDGITAGIILSGKEEVIETITNEDLYYHLRKNKISREFINTIKIDHLIENKTYNEEVEVAKAIEAVNGRNAEVDYKIDIANIGKPRETEDGKTDYKNIGKVITVIANEVIAEKIEPTTGLEGKNLYGDVIPPIPGEDISLPAGKNTLISDDGFKLYASVDGYIYTSELGINVGETFMVEGNLDFNTGNICYNGDVLIKQNVLPDFEVISLKGDIYIDGEVENSRIEAKEGNVFIKKGVFGDNTLIKGKDISLDFVQGESTVIADTITIKKFCYGGHLKGQDMVKATAVMGGTVESQKEIIIDEVGSESNSETIVKIYNERVEEISELLEKSEADKKNVELSLSDLTSQIQLLKRTLTIKKNITAEEKQNAAKKIADYNKLKKLSDALESNMQALRDERHTILSAADAKVEIKHKMFPNTKIEFFSSKFVSKELFTTHKVIDINTLKL